MKIKKWIETQAEVDVHVSAEDIVGMFAESPTERAELLAGLSNIATFLRGIPDDAIAEMNRHQRIVVTQFLTEQIRRFTPPEVENG